MKSALTMPALKGKAAILLLVGLGLLLLVGANAHLVYVAVTSQPDCVAHIRHGDGDAARDRFSAARSSCLPR